MEKNFEKQEPPQRRGRPNKWTDEINKMKADPGEWYLLGQGSAGTANAWTSGRIGGTKPKEFQTRRDVRLDLDPDGKVFDIYAKYVGE